MEFSDLFVKNFNSRQINTLIPIVTKHRKRPAMHENRGVGSIIQQVDTGDHLHLYNPT
jgi:hypothetical protein